MVTTMTAQEFYRHLLDKGYNNPAIQNLITNQWYASGRPTELLSPDLDTAIMQHLELDRVAVAKVIGQTDWQDLLADAEQKVVAGESRHSIDEVLTFEAKPEVEKNKDRKKWLDRKKPKEVAEPDPKK